MGGGSDNDPNVANIPPVNIPWLQVLGRALLLLGGIGFIISIALSLINYPYTVWLILGSIATMMVGVGLDPDWFTEITGFTKY